MSPAIKVTYFNGTGRAELTRLILTIGGVEFEDERLDGAAFGALKPTLPLGQIPVITVDGVTYAQSMAMVRYAGKITGLYPADAVEALKVDMVSETLCDGVSTMVSILWGTTDEAEKAEKSKKFVEEGLPKIYGMIEKQIQGKYVLGDKISSADVQLFDFTTNGLSKFEDFKLSAYPKISAIVADIKANPLVAAFLAKHQ